MHPVAGALAVLFPGAGHLYLGHPRRAALIAAGILFLFFAGLFIGGINAIDSKENRIWFFGQALVGPLSFGVDWAHQTRFKGLDPVTRELRSPGPREKRVYESIDPWTGRQLQRPLPIIRPAGPGEGPPAEKSLARVNELGILFITIAGMLNLIVILDALFHRPPRETVRYRSLLDAPPPPSRTPGARA